MEEKEGVNSAVVTLNGNELFQNYRIAPTANETCNNGFIGSAGVVTPANPVSVAAATTTEVKKKRGRPKKYGPDGSLNTALSPMPISASIPLSGDFSGWKNSGSRPVESFKKKQSKFGLASPGETVGYSVGASFSPRAAYSVGANFTPHVITVNAGEDVTMKIISFAQQGSRAICVLAANGAISSVTLGQPSSSGGTLTYEGRFEILSLTGSYMSSDNGVTKSRAGGMSVSLSGPDGRVIGGGLAGMLIAAGPIQLVVGSFIPAHQQEQVPKKQKIEPVYEDKTRPNPNVPFPEDNLHTSRIPALANNISMPAVDSKDETPSSGFNLMS